ncbi:matrix-remodeling-associated protein 7 isoform X1 [Genypterus blacodes]|uniref:matrix-remodeling-associated protein 7 isoform X1 n=1 Tax=Genypterus blacodes TaxID=154954 RepID=UPI003F76DBF5
MDLTFVLSAVIFTLLAIVVATSLLRSSSPSANAKSQCGHTTDGAPGRLDQPEPVHNDSVLDKSYKAAEEWREISGDVVKPAQAEESHLHPHTEELTEFPPSTSSLTDHRPALWVTSLDVDSSAEASSESSHRSFIGLSEKDLLKCAFSSFQSEGATESSEINDDMESDDFDSLKYVPGKARSHHLQVMMSKQELEEEQRVQCEQLAAIFQLLRDNKDAFGDVSEGDMDEQLKLYSI